MTTILVVIVLAARFAVDPPLLLLGSIGGALSSSYKVSLLVSSIVWVVYSAVYSMLLAYQQLNPSNHMWLISAGIAAYALGACGYGAKMFWKRNMRN